MQWHNTRRYAHLSDTELASIRTQPCGCHIIGDRFKEGGHLRTSDPHVLPDRGSLHQLCAMGAKFRPSIESAVLDASSKTDIISSLTSSVKDFARKSADRALNTEWMNEWQALVIQRIIDTVNNIPDGLCCSTATPLSYTQSDEIEMRAFLRDKVCTSMDKAAGTIMFNCQRDYVDRMQTDLDANAVFEISPRTQSDIVHESNDFGSRYGFAPDMRNQDIPYYKGIDKMHKDPVGTRFISSSAKSHMSLNVYLCFSTFCSMPLALTLTSCLGKSYRAWAFLQHGRPAAGF
jgi:hypothetical protein